MIHRVHLKLDFIFFSVACLKVQTLAKNRCKNISEIGTGAVGDAFEDKPYSGPKEPSVKLLV